MDLVEGLDPAQLAAVTNPTDPVCVLARAGAGKTRVLTRRIAWRAAEGGIDVRRVLAITFTTRAARELRDRLGALLGRDTGTTGTFHALAYRMIRDRHADRGTTAPTILEEPRTLLDEILGPRRRGGTDRILGEIAWASARGVEPGSYAAAARAAGRVPPADPDGVAEAIGRYRVEKRRRGVVDFDDLIGDAAELLETDEAFAQVQRWRHRHFFVDEYQDVNPLQQRLLDALLGGREDLFVVGDPNQAIYGFNGADASFLTDFSGRHPTATVIELTHNHRSTSDIVHAADSVLDRDGPGAPGPSDSAPTITACADEQAEALTIVRRARQEHAPGHRWSSQAVLVRTRAQIPPIAEMFARAGIPVATTQRDDARNAVRILTFHAAKGLEWPVVHVAGLEEGHVPDFHAKDAPALAEERRLLYVAVSRATRRVHLTWARQRSFGGRVSPRRVTRWMPQVQVATTRTATSVSPTADPGVPPGAEDATRDRLRRWRTAVARAAAVPDSVVVEDTVLEELIRTAPRDIDELLQVRGVGPIRANRYGTDLLDLLNPGSTQ